MTRSICLAACLLCAITAYSQQLQSDSLTMIRKGYEYRGEKLRNLMVLEKEFLLLEDPTLLEAYRKYKRTHRWGSARAALGGLQLGFSAASLILNSPAFSKRTYYVLLGTGLATTAVSFAIGGSEKKKARKVVSDYNRLKLTTV